MMTQYNKMKFLAPEDGGGSGDGPRAVEMLREPASPVKAQNEPGQVVAPVTPPPAASFDYAALAREMGPAIASAIPKPAESAKTPPTEAEMRKALNMMEFDDNFLTEFGNPTTQKASLEKMRDGIVKQMDTIAQYRLKEQHDAMTKVFEERFGPVAKQFEQNQTEQQMQRFATAYPQLSAPNLKPLIDGVTAQLVAQGKRFPTEKECFDAIAAGAENVIKVQVPTFKLTAAQAAITKPSHNANALPVTTPGSGGGAGSSSGGVDTRPRAVQLLRSK